MKSAIRLATFGVPLSGNKGSVSMLLGLMDAFEEAKIPARFDVFSYYPKRDQDLAAGFESLEVHPGNPWNIIFGLIPAILVSSWFPCKIPRRWEKALEALRNCDAILAMGGTTFSDEMWWKSPWNALPALVAALLGKKPLLFMPQTLGPMRRKVNRFFARWALRKASFIYGRDRVSVEGVRRLGIDRSAYYPGLAFSMKVPEACDIFQQSASLRRLQRILEETPDRRPVGIVPNCLVYEIARRSGVDYIGILSRVIRAIRESGYSPILIPHTYRREARSWHNNDHPLCLAILRQTKDTSNVFYVEEDLDARMLRLLIEQMHLVITSRFHAMVSALAMGVPPLTIGWGEHKYAAVLKEYGLEHLYTPASALNFERILRDFSAVAASRDQLSAMIRAQSDTMRRQARGITDHLLGVLGTAVSEQRVGETLFPH